MVISSFLIEQHILHRCHPYRGGTFHRDSRSEHSGLLSACSDTPSNEGDGPLISFTFIDAAYPNSCEARSRDTILACSFNRSDNE